MSVRTNGDEKVGGEEDAAFEQDMIDRLWSLGFGIGAIQEDVRETKIRQPEKNRRRKEYLKAKRPFERDC